MTLDKLSVWCIPFRLSISIPFSDCLGYDNGSWSPGSFTKREQICCFLPMRLSLVKLL